MASSGWKNFPIDWISPVRHLGALRNHASFSSATVRGLTSPEGNTGGAPSSAEGLTSSRLPRSRHTDLLRYRDSRSSRVAKFPLVITDRPSALRVARQSVQ